jgi:hypothetical protein
MTDPQCQVCDKSVTGRGVVDLAKREIKLNRQRNALPAAKGAWTRQDHPELAQGAAQWVRDIRRRRVRKSGLNSSVL